MLKLNLLNTPTLQTKSWLYLIVITLLAVVSRLVPHLPNATGVMALAIFIGLNQDYLTNSQSGRQWLKLIPLGVMLACDLWLGGYELGVMIAVYGSIWLATWIGQLNRQRQLIDIFLAGLLGSLIFYLVTNSAVVIFGDLYAKTPSGLMASLVAGLPFWRNSLIGDLGYLAIYQIGLGLVIYTHNIHYPAHKESHESSYLS